MTRVNRILNHPLYTKYYEKICFHEKNRVFCRHNMEHFMDVARICYILNLEHQLGIAKDVIYGTALLHDIGRFVQYETGVGHEIASADLAPPILKDAGFHDMEITTICNAILSHRRKDVLDISCITMDTFENCIYVADKLSRKCYLCEVQKECNWKTKNIEIVY